MKVGDTVRFHAETESWSIEDWRMSPDEEDDGFVEYIRSCDGKIGEITEIVIEGRERPLYVCIRLQDGLDLDGIHIAHVEVIDPRVRVLQARVA